MPQLVDTTPTIVTLIDFDTTNGSNPDSGLFIDANGDLFGTTNRGGTDNAGTVFELAKTTAGYVGTVSTLADLDNSGDGLLTGISKNGDLLGVMDFGGANNAGYLFDVAKTGGSYAGTLTVASNIGADDIDPSENLAADPDGNLFGISGSGGLAGDGAVFEIAKTGTGYAASTDLVSFDGVDGSVPEVGLYVDHAGNLFGTTQNGGAFGKGEVYEIVKTAGGYAANPTVLASFKTTDLGGSLIEDANGDLFGTSELDNSIFELAKTKSGYASTISVLATLTEANGDSPNGPLLIDAKGDLFGTAPFGGANNHGSVFELAKTASGYATTITTVVSFDGTNGDDIGRTLVADASGDLFGIDDQGGSPGDGTLFEITNSGFAVNPLCLLRGTKLAVPRGEVTVEDLRPGDWVTTAAGPVQVRWVGRRSYDGRFINGNHLALPVTIKAGALAEGVPARDLQVSPGHGVWLEGVLIPAWRLVNGCSVRQAAAVASVDYYNVELEGHGLLFAEGAAVESFLDNGAFRNQFQNVAEYWALYPDAGCRNVIALPRVESGIRLAEAQAKVNRRAGIVPAQDGAGALRGYVDTPGTGGWVHGWAQDMDAPEAAVILRIYARGSCVARTIANAYREDLREAGLGSGCHAFSCRVPLGYAGQVEVRREADNFPLPWAHGARAAAA